MNILFKKIISISIILVIVFSNSTFTQVLLNEQRGKDKDLELTYVNFLKSPSNICNGELVIMGDSYGLLLCEYSDKSFNYIVHQGYDVLKIFKEFLPLIKHNSYRYAFIILGPNDFFQQTELKTFKEILRNIIVDLKIKGIQLIVTDYCDPDYRSSIIKPYLLFSKKCSDYDAIIKELIDEESLLYVPMKDLLNVYGWIEKDFVHPNEKLYNPLIDRVESIVSNHKINFG